MSRLKELRLHGFKTFADATRFVFEPGVNAVIGPNGSGKSNMADAVRWVLGEQSNRSLRTRRADDVIFAGSQERKPQGMAEAILTLDNADGWLPIEFAEVTIGRRAYRSGETEYLINGARARLRDVVDLRGEGRLGANELVVVGQGTVDAALSLRPEERRQLFEEAAGVKNLQVRKNEALARFARARDNLTRVSDLIGELKPQVRRLALQAQHQQEHDVLGRRARALVGEGHRRSETAARSALGEARRRAAAAEAALESHRAAEAAGREAASAAEERYWQAEAAARLAGERREGTREERIRAESRLDGLRGRAAERERSVAAAAAELGEVEATLVAGTDEGPDAHGPVEAQRAAAEAAWRAASAALADAEAALVAAEEELAEARRRDGERIALEARQGELLARAAARREQLSGELAAAHAAATEAEAAISAARATSERAGARLTTARERHEAALAVLVEAQPRADAARRGAAELAERVGAMRGELEALHERAERGARLGSLLSAAGWSSLLDAVDAPGEAWAAIEAVVGGELEQVLLWRDGDLVDRLREARGAARLLATDDGGKEDDAQERRAALDAVGADGTLAEWIGAPTGPRLFRRVAVAPDLASLLRGWRQLPAGWVAVTPHGDLADGRGLVAVRGRDEAPGGADAERHARRRELADALARLEAEQSEAASTAAGQLGAVGEAARRLDAARAERDAAERAEHEARLEHEAIEGRLRRAAEVANSLAEELAAIERDEGGAASPDPGTPAGLEDLERAASDAREAQAAAATARDAAREAWRAARVEADRLEQREVSAPRAVLEARRLQLSASRPADAEALRRLQEERTAAQAAYDVARDADDAAAAERATADAARQEARAQLIALEREAGGGAARLAELERAAQLAAVAASRHEDALAALARERELALESLAAVEEAGDDAPGDEPGSARPAVADVPTDPALAAELAALDDGALEVEVRRVRRTLAQIGSVNPFAVEEHAELAARLDELVSQDSDLTAAIGSTEELVATLDAQIVGQFNAAFAAIGERFDEFCRLLFAGGSASLQLGEGEDGDAPGGIEIVVRPPGKRLQRLAMLSGGERALTGVALLFAMLSVNPVPFCILDEVDAALDEANIGRFADALRHLAERIDFVVITHNRATIEVADTIYGVTMTDAAVSRVVSLRLADLPAEVLA
ncbi:MAG TPA: chromosome segregation protein SMC [Candidatus Binatia bacterium]|nr:chromosome segregation protein SMC [Candidatus Binatia bacterium]